MLQTLTFEKFHVHPWLWRGVGHCSGHFGEIIQGQFTDPINSSFRGLVTLSCRSVGSTATAKIVPGSGVIHTQKGRVKVKKAVQVYRSLHLVPEDLDFIIDIESNIPSGIGMGSSTADIVATLRAMDQAYGQHTELEDLVGLVLQVEKACDSTMLDHRVRLFAQRDGKVLENFGCRLPPLYVLGFNMMPGEVFKTDDMPPANYSREELARFDQLLSMLRIAVHAGDCRKIAEIATESALINERKYPKRNFGYLMDIRTALNAAGVCVSHSGTIAGLIFPINELPCPATLTEVSSEVRSWGGEYLGLYRM